MSERAHTPADVRERVKEAWAIVEAAALAQAARVEEYELANDEAAEIRDAVAQVAALLRTPRGEGERGLIMRTMLETFPWSPDIRQEHFERAADAVIAALRSEAQGEADDFNPLTDLLPEHEAERVERVLSRAARRGDGGA